MGARVGLLILCLTALACASSPTASVPSEHYGFRGDWVWVHGPWERIAPSSDADEVIDQLCPAIMGMPRASRGEYGQEYCGALYLLGGLYYASHPSPLGSMMRIGGREARKQCKPPRYVEDTRGQPTVIADFHSHPWPTPMSQQDRRGPNQLWSIRVQFDSRCRVMKLIPNLDNERPGELFERQEKQWKLIGLIQPEDKDTGYVTSVESR